jgi:competence protein ComEC
MIAGILCILLGLIWEVAGLLPGFVIHLILKFYECSCKGTGRLPGGTAYVGHAELWQVVIYLLLIAAYVILHDVHITQRLFALHNKMIKMKYRNCKETELFVIRSVLIIAGLIIIFYRPSYGLKISFLDVGQGDGIVIESGREAYLIDGGSTSKKEVGKYQLKPFLAYEGIGHLNAVILTHEDEDHMSGMMELMEDTVNDGIRIDNLILPDISDKAKKENYRKLEQAAALYHIPVSYISREDTIKTGNKELSITCLGPVRDMCTDEPNAYSTILYVKYRSFTALLTGDVEGQGQENLTEYIKESSLGQEELTEYNRESCLGQDWSLTAASRASDAEKSDIHSLPAQVTLLKVAHHGSRYTTDQEFLDLVDPQIAIISCGKNNTYGHPHQEVLDRLDSIGSKIYRTDQQGCITITIDRSDSNRVKCKTFITQNTK